MKDMERVEMYGKEEFLQVVREEREYVNDVLQRAQVFIAPFRGDPTEGMESQGEVKRRYKDIREISFPSAPEAVLRLAEEMIVSHEDQREGQRRLLAERGEEKRDDRDDVTSLVDLLFRCSFDIQLQGQEEPKGEQEIGKAGHPRHRLCMDRMNSKE